MRLPELLKFSREEQWQLMIELEEELWHGDREGERADVILVELERRRAHYEAYPESTMTLDEARRRMLGSRHECVGVPAWG